MKKKGFIGLALLGLVCALSAFAVGCSDESKAHDLTLIKEKAATCTEDGIGAYYACADCDLIFSDAEAKNQTTLEALKIPALGHDLAKVEAQAADCVTPGNIEHYACTRCGETYADAAGTQAVSEVSLAALGHDIVKIAQQDPTVEREGRKAHYVCANEPDVYFSDSYGDNPVGLEELLIAKVKENIDGTATGDFYHTANAYIVGAADAGRRKGYRRACLPSGGRRLSARQAEP